MKNTALSLRRITYMTAISVLTLILALSMILSVSAAENENIISSITLNKAQTELTVEIALSKEYVKENKSSSLYLFEFNPHESTDDISALEPIADFKTSSKITVKIPFESGNSNRLYSKFAVAEKSANGEYTIISPVHSVDNFSSYAKNSEPFPTGSSKKGLKIQSFSDAQLLGVQHTVIDIPINEYMFGEMTDGATSFVFGGRTYYINESKLLVLDHLVRTYTEAGINVYFNILLTAPKADYHESILSLYCDGISSESTYYALNTHSEASMNLYAAFMDYICERYTTAGHTYGFVPAIILGFEVNSGGKLNDFGSCLPEDYVESYASALRVADTAMRSHYANGIIYVSLGNGFAVSNGEKGIAAKDFLDSLNSLIKSSGDIPWGISINPYPSDAGLIDYWNDSAAKDDISTEYVTMKNIGILTEYVNDKNFLFEGETRSVIVGEFAVPGSPDDDTSMTMQAAAYALAYYTADQNEDIDAFIYNRHVDVPGEAYNYGLWTSADGENPTPSAKKPIYNVFSLIDTSRSEEATAFVKQTVGSEAFHMFLSEKVKYKIFDDRTLISESSVSSSELKKGYKDEVLFDLTAGKLCNFYPSDGTEYVELRPLSDGSGTMLYARVTDIPTEYKGIENNMENTSAFKNARYITLRVMVEAPVEVSNINVMLRLQKNGDSQSDTAVFEGTVQVKPNEWQDISFKIDELVKVSEGDIDLLKLWINVNDREPAEGNYGIWLENVVLHTKGGISFIGGLFIFILVIIGIAVVGYVILYLRAQYIRRRRREEMNRRRREQLRMRAIQQNGPHNQPYNRPRSSIWQNNDDE